MTKKPIHGNHISKGQDGENMPSRQDEVHVRQLFASNPMPMWIHDLESLAFLVVNDAAISCYGYGRKEFLSMTYNDFLAPEAMPPQTNHHTSVCNLLEKSVIQRHIRKDGRIIDVEVNSHIVQFEGRLAKMVLANDITERKRVEDTLCRYEHIISSTNDLMSFVDRHYVYRAVNDAYLMAYGRKREEIVGSTVEQIMGSKVFETTIKDNLDRALGGEKIQYQVWFDFPDTRRRFMDVTHNPFKNALNEIEGVVICVHDLTARKQAEQALEQSLEKFEKAFQAAPVWVMLSTLEKGRYIEVNDAFLSTTGYEKHEVVGKTPLEIKTWIEPRDRERIVARVKATGGVHNVQVQRRTRSGKILETLFSAKALELKGMRVMISVTQDITEQKKVEAEREYLQAQLLQAQKMESVGRLAGGVAHDFNNMLGVILGRIELMLMEMDPKDPGHESLDEIYKAARRSADLTRQLLAFARKQTIAPRILNLNDTVESMFTMLRRLIGEDINLVWKPGSQLWPVKIDPAQVDQILANLCVNARDAIERTGLVTIKTDNVVLSPADGVRHPGFKPGHYVLLTVSDNGCGMSKETRQRIFDPFFTTKETGKGSGLGLSTVYGIVKQNQGFIDVISEPGQGATFKIYLPPIRHTLAGTQKAKESGAKMGTETVLLVEDEASVLRLGTAILERFGYKVLAVRTAKQAISITEKYDEPIHILVTDVVMPGMSGKEVMIQIEKLKPRIKTLFMSGYTGDAIMQKGIKKGEVNFLQKPFSIDTLASMVRKVLDGKG